jgi:hypothetical protein
MSAALDKGYLRGREYLRRCPIETLTFEQYKQLGRVDVRQQYKQKKAIDQYLLGWWHAGEQFASLFKPDNDESYSALKRIAEIQQRLGALIKELDVLQDWRENDLILQSHLEDAADYIRYALGELSRAEEHIESEKAQ